MNMKLKDAISIAIAFAQIKILRKSIPVVVSWSLTDRCNYRCKYCDRWGRKTEELTNRQILHIIDELAQMGTKIINFTGGEPLMREDIGEIVNYAQKKGMWVGINSNGSFVLAKIIEIDKIDLLTLSFDGPEDIQDGQRYPGSYRDIIDAVKVAIRNNMNVMFYAVITKNNVNHIDSILQIAQTFGIRVQFSPLEFLPFSNNEEIRQLLPSQEDYKEAISELIKERKAGNRCIANSLSGLSHLYNWPLPIKINCYSRRVYCRIETDGNLYSCGSMIGKAPRLNCIEIGFRKAFEKLLHVTCENCWCAYRIEMNLLFAVNPSVILSAIESIRR